MRILITGKHGQLGQTLQKHLGAAGYEILTTGRQDLDLRAIDSIPENLNRLDFDVLINTAAYTAVDQAEKEVDLAFTVNAEAPAVMAEYCAKQQKPFIHFSTDFVFDGLISRPYVEDDRTNPINVYGASKAKGEEEVLARFPDAVILRTSWVYAGAGKNFLLTMMRLGAEREKLSVVKDQIGTPTATQTLATAVEMILLKEPFLAGGIYHLSDEGVASWYDFANQIMEIAELDCEVFPIPASDYPTPARRPRFSLMDKSKISAALNWEIPHWRQSLKRVIKNLD
jgi:dTDP-4-dehydrorhamnose reductase